MKPDFNFERFVEPGNKRCPFRAEFDVMREEWVERTLNSRRLAALETLRSVVAGVIEDREKKTGFFDEAAAWKIIESAMDGCR